MFKIYVWYNLIGLWKGEGEVPDCQVRGSPDGANQKEAQGGDVDVWSSPETLLLRGNLIVGNYLYSDEGQNHLLSEKLSTILILLS